MGTHQMGSTRGLAARVLSARGFSARGLAAAIAALAAVTLLTACGDEDVDSTFTVGHDRTTESQVAAAVYADALARTGIRVRTLDDSADSGELLDQVASGRLGLFPSFTGDLLRQLTPHPSALSAEDVLDDVNRSLPEKVSIGDPALVSDRWQVIVAQHSLEETGVEKLADCGRFPAGMPLVVSRTPPRSVLDAVAVCRPGPVEQVASPEAVVSRVRAGGVLGLATALDAASVDDLTDVQTLKSDGAPIAQQLVPVYASGRMQKAQLKALSRVAGELTTADLAQLVREVRGGADPHAVARDWLSTRG